MKSEPMSDQKRKLEAIFHAAQELSDLDQREIYIRDACQGDPALRAKVEGLLRASAEAESVFAHSNTTPEVPATIRLDLSPEEPAGTVVGRYKLLQKIGEGGMGVVYMAEQTEPVTRKVALKIIKLGMNTKQVVARFEAERQALAMMDHPCIARALDAGATESGRPYFVMELVQGVPITEYCDRAKLSAKERLKLFVQVCQAVQSAHQKGVIHRDLKPSNILVTLHHGDPMPKVIDFGIAKATNQKLTEKTLFTSHATMIGTPAYMSPEQAEISSMDVDTRTDIYSLGVLLYELLTGSTPFPEKRLRSLGYGEMQRVIADEEPERPSTRLSTMADEQKTVVAKNRGEDLAELSRTLRGDLDWVVMRCLEKDRRRRYETANGLAADIQRHLNHEPVVARPPSAAYRFQKLVRRNKLAVAASALVLMVLLLGVAISTWQALRATRAELKQSELAEQATRAQDREAKQRSVSEQRLYDLLFSVANSKRQARSAGYRNEVFQHLRQAATLDVPQKDPLALRDIATSCLGDIAGLTPILITNFPADTQIKEFRIDPSGQLGAFTLLDGSIQLRRLPSGEELERLNLHGEYPAVRCEFSEDGQELGSLHYMDSDPSQNSVSIWSRPSDGRWRRLKRYQTPHAENLGVLNGNFFVCLNDKPAHVYKAVDLETQRIIAQLELKHPGRVIWLRYTTSGLLIMVPQEVNFTVHVWDVREGRKLPELHPKLEGFESLFASKDGRWLICSGKNGAEIYSLPKLERVAGLPLPGQMLDRRLASFAQNDVMVGVSVDHRRLRVWDWANDREVATFEDVDMEAGLGFTADDDYLVAVGSRQARLYPLSANNEQTVVSNQKKVRNAVGFSPDSRRFGFVRGDGELVVGDVWTGQSLWETNLIEGLADGFSFVSFRHDGLMAIASMADLLPKLPRAGEATKTNAVVTSITKAELTFWSEQRRLRVVNESAHLPPFIYAPEFTPDGRFLLAMGTADPGESDAHCYLWRVNRALSEPSADSLKLETVMKTEACNGAIMAVHNQHFAYASWPTNGVSEIHLVEFGGQQIDRILRRGFSDGAGFQMLGFAPDGRRLLAATTNDEIVALDIVTGEAVTPPLKPRMFPRADNRKRLSFSLSPDGSKLAVFFFVDPGAGVEIWDWKGRQYLYSLPEPSGRVFYSRWSPDSRHLAVCSESETSIWHLTVVERALADLGLFAEAAVSGPPRTGARIK